MENALTAIFNDLVVFLKDYVPEDETINPFIDTINGITECENLIREQSDNYDLSNNTGKNTAQYLLINNPKKIQELIITLKDIKNKTLTLFNKNDQNRLIYLIKLLDNFELGVLTTINEQLIFSKKELKTVDQIETDFINSVAHEIKNSLVAVKGYSELMSKERLGPVNEHQRSGLNTILICIEKLLSIVNSLLDYSKLTRGIVTLDIKQYDLNKIIDDVILLLTPNLEVNKISIDKIIEDEISVLIDKEKIFQVLIYIFSNVIKTCESGDKIYIVIMPLHNSFTRIAISSDSDINNITEDFIKNNFKQENKINFIINKLVVELHGGKISSFFFKGQKDSYILSLPSK